MPVFLVCEGANDGLDNRVLDPLVIQHHNLTVQMAPSGGSGGLGGVRVYLRNLARITLAGKLLTKSMVTLHNSPAGEMSHGYLLARRS